MVSVTAAPAAPVVVASVVVTRACSVSSSGDALAAKETMAVPDVYAEARARTFHYWPHLPTHTPAVVPATDAT